MQSEYAQSVLAELLLSGALPKSSFKIIEDGDNKVIELTSFLLIEKPSSNLFSDLSDSRIYTKTNAALRIATRLDRAWFLFNIFRIVPALVRDSIYDFVARHRYKWFGKRSHCRIPTAEESSRFIQ